MFKKWLFGTTIECAYCKQKYVVDRISEEGKKQPNYCSIQCIQGYIYDTETINNPDIW